MLDQDLSRSSITRFPSTAQLPQGTVWHGLALPLTSPMPERRSTSYAGDAQDSTVNNDNVSRGNNSNKNKSAPDRGDGPPPKKFQRVYRACNRCRSKKEKCDGGQPSCSACTSANQPCIVESGVRKRGLPQGYVRVLEMLLGSVLSTLQGSDDALKALLDRLSIETAAEWRLSVLERWKSSSLVKDVERILPTLDVPDERDILNRGSKILALMSADGSRAADLTPVGWRLPSNDRMDLARIPSNTSQDTFRLRRGTEQVQDSFAHSEHMPDMFYNDGSSNNIGQSPGGEKETPSTLPIALTLDHSIRRLSLPTTAWHLLDVFFAYTNCWLSIIDKVDVLRIAYTYSSQPLEMSRNNAGSGMHAALWAILAYASRQASSDQSASYQAGSPSGVDWTSEQLYDVARGLVPGEDGQYETGHVQALLLLGLCKIGAGQWTEAWLLIGYAVRVALVLNLHNEVEGRKKHVFLGCFILDTLVAAKLEKLPHLRTEIVQRVGGIPENDLEEWDPWLAPSELSGRPGQEVTQRRPAHAGSTFNQLIKVACIFNDITCFTPHTALSQNQYQRFSQTLRDWRRELPRQCQFAWPVRESVCPLPHVLGLHLFHLTAYTSLELRKPEHTLPDLAKTFDGELTNVCVCLFEHFETYGIVAVPPFYNITAIMALRCGRVDNSQREENGYQAKLERTLSQMSQVWSPKFGVTQEHQISEVLRNDSVRATGLLTTTNPVAQSTQPPSVLPPRRESTRHFDTPYGLMDYSSHAGPNSDGIDPRLENTPPWTQPYISINSMMGMSSMLQNPLGEDMTLLTTDQMNDPGLQPMPMEELDSILEELSTLDSSDMASRQSQFLRNFGFGPDMTPAQLGYMYGQQDMPTSNPD